MAEPDPRVREHCQLTRRFFLQAGSAAAAAWSASPLAAENADMDPQLIDAAAQFEYLTGNDKTWNVLDKLKSGAPKLPPDKLQLKPIPMRSRRSMVSLINMDINLQPRVRPFPTM